MRSTKPKKPLTRAEIAAAYKRRQSQERRTELRELVALAYELGRKTKHAAAIPPSRLLTTIKELRTAKSAAKTSKRAAAYLALLEGAKPATTTEIREALETREKPALPTLAAHLDRLLNDGTTTKQ